MTGRLWRLALYVIAVAALATAFWVAALRPLELTMPVYLELSQRLLDGPVPSSFEPLGYSWLISLMPGDSLPVAAKRLHLLCYVTFVALCVLLVRRRITASFDRALRRQEAYRLMLVLLSAWVMFNPYVLVNISRLNDNNVNIVAVVALFALIQGRSELAGGAWRTIDAVSAGVLIGGFALVRPNALSLFAALLFVFYQDGRSLRAAGRTVSRLIGLAAVAMVVTYVAGAFLITGQPRFWPGNGPYNLFAGNNPGSTEALLRDYNAEPSLIDGLAWCGVGAEPRAVPSTQYLRCTGRYIAEQPLQAARLSVLKFYNMMFRPNLRLAGTMAEGAAQWLMVALPVAWWTTTAWVLVRQRRLFDPIATVFCVVYALPLVLTNSDPRFRLPLDAVYAFSFMAHGGAVSAAATLRREARAV